MFSYCTAIRSLGEACENKNINLSKYPEDYELFVIGEFNAETGEIKPIESKSNTISHK